MLGRPAARVLRSVALGALALLSLLPLSCGDGGGGGKAELTVFAEGALEPSLGDFVGYMGDERAAFETAGDPAAAAEKGRGVRIAVLADLGCTECYRIEAAGADDDGGAVFVVHGDAPLGVQYGLARLLEQMGYGFYHPWRTRLPASIDAPAAADLPTETVEPEMSLRGLRPHTLHPIESYFDLWEPGEDNLAGAQRTVDWVVKNRGNFLGWVGLNDVQESASAREAWRPHTRAILDYAHARGLETGIDVQLFSSGNLQLAYDLVDTGSEASIEEQVRERMAPLEGLPFDQIQMSFGEFFAEEPDAFIDATDRARTTIGEVMGGDVTVTGSIHVGGDLRVTWDGMDIPYYHLVVHTETEIVPWVHTVMYYNLFENTGGAYELDDFSEHRELLLSRLRAGEPTVYFPETAYWVAFDNPIPTYLPLYVRSRWLDLARIREEAEAGGFDDLDGHVIFSSGWEWGYWQNDWAALRMSYRLPDSWEALFDEMLRPFGAPGAELAAQLAELTRVQQRALIEQELTAYYAGRDSTIDLGDEMGIHSQPDRPSFAEVAAMDEAALSTFETDVVERLGTFADETAAVRDAVDAIDLPEDDPWIAEIRDGLAVDVLRARFAHAVWRAAVANARGEDVSALVEEAQGHMEAAQTVVDRRFEHMHDPDPDTLVARRRRNATLYDYGYLREAHTLCFWQRELAKLQNEAQGASERVPGCVL